MDNKIVLVIGSSGGIGSKTTEILLQDGYTVIGTYLKGEVSQISSSNFSSIQVDLTNVENIKTLFESLKDKKFYAIVNCAGICKYEGQSLDEDFKTWNETIAINLSANFIIAKLFQNNINQDGRFIMISSTDSYYGGSITAAYSASKIGVNSLTKSLSLFFKDKQIRVNAVAPGWVDTPMVAGDGVEFLNKVANINPLKRIAKAEDIAKTIKFLLSPDSEYINGQVITVDGGYTNQDPTLLLEEETQS